MQIFVDTKYRIRYKFFLLKKTVTHRKKSQVQIYSVIQKKKTVVYVTFLEVQIFPVHAENCWELLPPEKFRNLQISCVGLIFSIYIENF